MNVLIFGASGMLGQGVLRECLLAADVAQVRAVGRTALTQRDGKLSNLVHTDLFDLGATDDLKAQLTGFDACFFTLGTSAAGLTEAQYSRVTYDLTLAVAQVLAQLNPQMTFIYVSGAATDSTEKGRIMWARVKGRTENALQRLPFKAVYLFRPGVIAPLDGIVSKTPVYRVLYSLTKPVLAVTRALFPNALATTRSIGQAMLEAARHGAPQPICEVKDIAALAAKASSGT